MENNNPRAKKSRDNSEKTERSFSREDSKRRESSTKTYTPFAKDKRERAKTAGKSAGKKDEKPTRRDDEGATRERRTERSEERRSFNPNFTKDNKKRDSGKSSDSRGRRDSDSEKRRESKGRDDYKSSSRSTRDGAGAAAGKESKYSKSETRGGGKGSAGGSRERDTRSSRDSRSEKGSAGKEYRERRVTTGDGGERRRSSTGGRKRSDTSEGVRLNKYIAASGVCSRREADENIRLGLVTVNGVVVTEMGVKVMPGDVVKFDGASVKNERKVYIVMNKPKGCVTTLDDPHADRTVIDLLKGEVAERVYPVGRLDKNSLGVLLLTNDGDLTKKLTHPSYNKKKIYHVTLDKQVTKADMEQIIEGVVLEDGEFHADEISYVGESRKEVGIEIHSGRNRIVRRVFEHLGYSVQKLDRVYFAGLTKMKLKRGDWRLLTPREVEILISGLYE